LVQKKKYRQAQSILQKLISANSDNAALHYALGYVQQQQEDWDEAYDSYQTSQALMPGLSDIHSRMAYVLYRSDDGDGAIAEARTALSIDPGNAEAVSLPGTWFVHQPQVCGRYPRLPAIAGSPA
jgi:tetratricopeptide (TPR) repeat protein